MFDVNLFTQLIDQLVRLWGARERNRREYFDRYVQPAYQTAELIYQDYKSLLQELRFKVMRGRRCGPIKRFLEDRRNKILPARSKLRALITHRIREGRSTRLEAGILGLMSGAITAVDGPYFRVYMYNKDDASIQSQADRHTVLDILHKLNVKDSDHLSEVLRNKLIETIDKKLDGIEQSWQDVVGGYGEFEAETLPPPSIGKKARGPQEVQKLYHEVCRMARSGKFNRPVAIEFENAVAIICPELTDLAQEIRETIHDLDNREPNISLDDLTIRLVKFEQQTARLAQKKMVRPNSVERK